MGKVKKVVLANKDEGQTKISAFFQKPVEKTSKLFSEVGASSTNSAMPTKVSPTCLSKAKENRSPSGFIKIISDDADLDEFAPVKKIRSPNSEPELLEKNAQLRHFRGQVIKQVSSPRKSPTEVRKTKEIDPAVVPETQLIFTPESKNMKDSQILKGQNPGSVIFQSPVLGPCNGVSDFGIIPDTPDSSDIQVKPKKPLARSFLLSAASIASNPIQKAKEKREAKLTLKKKANLAKKSMMPITVELEDQNSPANGIKHISSLMGPTCKNVDSDFVADIEKNAIEEHAIAVNGCQAERIPADDKTPTKVYLNAETCVIKRMAKPGISPISKRPDTQTYSVNILTPDDTMRVLKFEDEIDQIVDTEATDNGNSGPFDNLHSAEKIDKSVEPLGDVIEFEKERRERQRLKKEKLEKRRLELLNERRKKNKELQKKNQVKLLHYQLSGNATASETLSTADILASSKGSVKTDDTLEDILEELKSPTLLKIDQNPKCDSVSRSLSHGTIQGSLNKSEKALTSKICDKDSTCDKKPLLKSKMAQNSTSSGNLGKKFTEWTDEDEKFFKELGVRTDANAAEPSENLSGRNSLTDVSVNKDMLCENIIEKNKSSSFSVVPKEKETPKLETKGRVSNQKFIDAHSKPDLNVDIEFDIKDFQSQVNNVQGTVENDIALFSTPCFQELEKRERLLSPEEMEIDEFGSQLDSQLLCDEFEHLTPFKGSRPSDSAADIFQSEAPCSEFSRHIVTAVDHDRQNHETVLTLSSHPDEVTKKCIIHGFWLDTHVQVGDVVNVLAKFKDNTCHVTDTEGLLIVNPDMLLSGTTVVSSIFCMRKSILKEKFKGCDSGNIQMLYGSIIHSVFQQVLRKKLLTEEAILEEAEKIVRQLSNLMEMYGNNVTEHVVMDEVKNYLPQTIGWTKQHTNIGQDIFGNQRKTKPDILVTKVNDIEENIWSPRFGIKGKIDLTVEVQLQAEKSRKIVPLELKTGKPSYSVEHKGQVTLYSMMCSDRRENPEKGLLLYLKEPSMKVIPADHVNQKGLLQLRNEMAYYISRQVVKTVEQDKQTTFHLGRLPEPITNLRACQKCPQLINCAIYQREVEGRQSSGMSELVDDTLRHLNSSHMRYFTHWCLMLDLESQKDLAKRTVADIWCRSSKDREAVGECISGVVLTDDNDLGDENDDCLIVSFKRHRENKTTTPLSTVGVNVQDSMVVSCEKPSWIAVCTGFINDISATEVQLLIDREGVDRLSSLKSRVFRLDKCDSFSTAGMFYTNVSRLMLDDPHCQRLRQLIIERGRPEFLNTLSKGSIEKVKSIFKRLNKPQKTAVLKVLMSKDYVLIKGYPGTGKTSTIVTLVKVLSVLGYSVLLTSYTHSAVDNILLKLKKDSVKFLRLGRVAKVHPDIREFSAEKVTQGIKTTAQLEEFLHSQNVVATSCLGTNHPVFTRRKFDVCIVDEASQVIQPACLGPLFCCQKFVLVGDPKQLPPVVQSREARDLGMDKSLFVSLENTGGTFDLNLQYRMNSEIMYLSNHLVYDGCLKCGSESVASRVLILPHKDRISQVISTEPWIGDALDDRLGKSVVFLNTEKVPAMEEKSQAGGVQNPIEAKIVLKIVDALVLGGVDADDIGIIAPYRSQVYLIRSNLSEGEGHWRSKVEVNTVDQYQGRDKSVIIISFVRSTADQENMTGVLLKDIRRLNVALTRAKVKLILIGSITTLEHYSPMKQLIQLLEEKNQILQLPSGLQT